MLPLYYHLGKTHAFFWKNPLLFFVHRSSDLPRLSGYFQIRLLETLVSFYMVMAMGITLILKYLEKKELFINIHNQGDAADRLLDQINKRYNESLLIQEIGQASSMLPEVDKLLSFIMESLGKRLDFDRGMIMLVNKQKDVSFIR